MYLHLNLGEKKIEMWVFNNVKSLGKKEINIGLKKLKIIYIYKWWVFKLSLKMEIQMQPRKISNIRKK
jgi:hypothetical protein